MFRNLVNIFILFEAHVPKNRKHYESSDKNLWNSLFRRVIRASL